MPASAYLQATSFFGLAAIALFASAGTIAISGFWIYLLILGATFVASLLWLDPDLARERMRPGRKKPPQSLRVFSGVLLLHWIIAGLDRGRFHWSDRVSPSLQAVGIMAVAAGFGLIFWAMAVNRFFSSVVRIQHERGQYVVTTGPYRLIRHPGYAAGILFMLASGVALGSWIAAALLVVAGLPFILYRAITEDRLLRAELPGYRCYARRVRWRLCPWVW